MISSLATLGAALAMVWGTAIPPVPVPVSSAPPPRPEVTADAWVLYDATAGVVLDGVDVDVPRPMASVTKMMTAVVVRDVLDLDARVRVSETAAGVGESEVGLIPGERWSVRDLLYALLVRSANDAAVTLAEAAGGTVAGFAEMMNARAAALGLENTSFANPHGLDAAGHFASAADLAVLGAHLLDDPLLAEMVRTRIVAFRPAPNGSSRVIANTNQLLGDYPGVLGVKTGFTGDAGLVLVSALQTSERLLIGVVMGSDAHFDDSRELLEYGRRLVTYADRWAVPELLEEGGGGGTALGGDARTIRLRAVPDLWEGGGEVTLLADTRAGRDIEDRLRAHLPVLLGGTG